MSLKSETDEIYDDLKKKKEKILKKAKKKDCNFIYSHLFSSVCFHGSGSIYTLHIFSATKHLIMYMNLWVTKAYDKITVIKLDGISLKMFRSKPIMKAEILSLSGLKM